jgi:exodeoxyribonuclease V alpha subunit
MPAPEATVLEATVEDITFRNEHNGWTVMRLADGRERVTAVGVMPFVGAGERVRLMGEWGEHPIYGRQLNVSHMETLLPESKSDIERYLASGLIKGIGPASAKDIINHFGNETLTVLKSEPERLAEVKGIGIKRARMIAESFAEQRETRQVMMFLQNFDITPTLAQKIFKRFAFATQEIVSTNPYRLVDEIHGVGFKTADKIAFAGGLPHDSEYRLLCGLRYVLNEAAGNAGHVYLPRDVILEQAREILAVDTELIERALRKSILTGQLIECPAGEHTAIYLSNLYRAENDVAELLVKLKHSAANRVYEGAERLIAEYERSEGVTLSLEQRASVVEAVSGGICVITGGPGTGKTTGIKCVIALMSHVGEVLLAAPTGRAAKRMSEATDCPAKTIHRLLEFNPQEELFQRNEDNPLKAKMVIIDEMSMMDIFLMRSLLLALRPGTRLVMVGDADQLPSVGAGNVLSDIIKSGAVPVVKLTQVFRQAGESMIVWNAHLINQGKLPVMNRRQSDFFFERKESISDTVESVLRLVTKRLPGYMSFDPLRDIQVLSPTKKGDAGVWHLNRLMQARLNPHLPGMGEWTRGDTTFRVGDKVMQIKNNYQLEWVKNDDTGFGVFNGDMGFITAIDSENLQAEVIFDDDRTAVYSEAEMEELELAYCMSVHKSQGSEFPVVILPLFSGPPMLMVRNLLYTAVTRAKKLVVIVGREECILRMVSNNIIKSRFSALSHRIKTAGTAR